MACIDAAIWNKAQTDCANLSQSVKGFGYVPTGLRALRGLGAAPNLSVEAAVTYDPCAIAAQESCMRKPPSFQAAKPSATPKPPTVTTQAADVATAGFSHWGILAAVLVGGVVVYKIANR